MAMTPLSGSSFLGSYIEQNKRLARTMVIKSPISADLLNDYILLKNGEGSVDKYAPQTWKYYRNISGEYHPLDTPMTVTSLDTLEEIAFTKDNLRVHTATAEAYSFGTRYYYSLLNRYPNQEQLILGILYPVDIDVAIAAEEGTILGYPTELVEPQEKTLIKELEDFIKRHHIRWNVKAFGISDSLYNASYHGVMYLTILPKLLNLRLRRCKTDEVHSFHIREYLASNGGLDKYLPFMTLKQALFLYRNLRYLERNAGKMAILEKLIEKILTDRRIPIAEYSVRQLSEFDEEFYPLITARRKPINDQYNIAEKNFVDLHVLYGKEKKLTYGTERFYDATASAVDRQFQTSMSSVVQTKNLESNMVDYNDSVPDPLEEVLLRQWAHLAGHGLYEVVINFRDPKTSEIRSLYAKDALIYMVYVSLRSIGIEINTIPRFLNLKYRRHPKPSVQELLSVVDTSIEGIEEDAHDIWVNQPVIARCYSTSMFYSLSYRIYEEAKRHWLLMSNAHDMYRRAALNAMVLKLYEDEYMELGDQSVNIEDWLSGNNLPSYDFTHSQAEELIRNIFTESTGLSIDETKQLKNIQKAMLSLLGDLSSYSIQLIREINDSKIIPLNWAAIRNGGFLYSQVSDEWVETNNRINSVKGVQAVDVKHETGSVEVRSSVVDVEPIVVEMRIKNQAVMQFHDVRDASATFRSFSIDATYPGYDPAISGNTSIVGMEYFLALTDEQKNSLVSIYD